MKRAIRAAAHAADTETIHVALRPKDKLLPCPFCGGVDLALHNTHTASYWVECACGVEVNGRSYQGDARRATRRQHRLAANDAIARWNKRTQRSPAIIDEHYEQLAVCVNDIRNTFGVDNEVYVVDLADEVKSAMDRIVDRNVREATCKALERVQQAGTPVAEHTMLLGGIREHRFFWDQPRQDWVNKYTGTPHERA